MSDKNTGEVIPATDEQMDALAAELDRRRADPEFRARLQDRIVADKPILDRLTGAAAPAEPEPSSAELERILTEPAEEQR